MQNIIENIEEEASARTSNSASIETHSENDEQPTPKEKQVSAFHQLGLPPEIERAVDSLGFNSATEIQKLAIPQALAGQDLVALAATGSGKTLAYVLPMLARLLKSKNERCLILTPTREIAQQVLTVIESVTRKMKRSPQSVLVIGGLSGSRQARFLAKQPQIIVATPGRMNDHLQTNQGLLKNVTMVILDEADRMLDMGFAPQLKNIRKTMRDQWQTLLFSATMQDSVKSFLPIFVQNKIHEIRLKTVEKPVETLKQIVILGDRTQLKNRLLDDLNSESGATLVFARTQVRCHQLFKHLDSFGYKVDELHGGLPQGKRNRVMANFRDGRTKILVATDLAARGLDVKGISLVLNYDLSPQPEDYLHRIGRTARAGQGGRAITYATTDDKWSLKRIQNYLNGAEEIMLEGFSWPAGRGGGSSQRNSRGGGGRGASRGFGSRGGGRGSRDEGRSSRGFSERRTRSEFRDEAASEPRAERAPRGEYRGERREDTRDESSRRPRFEGRSERFESKPPRSNRERPHFEDGERTERPFRKSFGEDKRSSFKKPFGRSNDRRERFDGDDQRPQRSESRGNWSSEKRPARGGSAEGRRGGGARGRSARFGDKPKSRDGGGFKSPSRKSRPENRRHF